MRRASSLLALLALGCATSPKVADEDQTCPRPSVIVSFTSICCGIDQEAVRIVDEVLDHLAFDKNVTRRPWGREGEFDLCISTDNKLAAERVFHTLVLSVPINPTRPPTTIRIPGGKSFNSTATNDKLAD